MITNPSSIDKSILKYEAIGKGMKLTKQIELSVYIIQAIRFYAYVIKGLMIILKKEYHSYYKANQNFIVHCLRDKSKDNFINKTDTKKKINAIKADNNHQISDMSLFNSECLISDSYDPRLFGNKMLSSPYKEGRKTSKSKQQFGSLFSNESHNKTIQQLLNNNNASKSQNKNDNSIKKNDLNMKSKNSDNNKSISPCGLGHLNENLINSHNMNNDISSINIANNNLKNGLNIDVNNNEELLSNFIDFDIGMDPMIHQLHLDGENENNNINDNSKSQNNNINNNTTNKKEYITPIKLITADSNPQEILKRFNSSNYNNTNKAVKFLIKEKSHAKQEQTRKILEYDKNSILLSPLDVNKVQSNQINDNDNDNIKKEEFNRFRKLYQNVIKYTLIQSDFNKFKQKLNQIEFDKSLLVSEVLLLNYNKNINTNQKESGQSSYEQLRYGERGDNSSLDNSASVISNLSLKEVFDTNKKLINKTSAVINYPSIVGVIEEEDSNFNLNSMNTFNLKSTFNNNNNNNLDLNFEDINEEDRENDDNYNCNNNNSAAALEALYSQFKALKCNKEILIDNIANNINVPLKTNHTEINALVFYHLMLYAQKNDLVLYQQKSFGPIYLK